MVDVPDDLLKALGQVQRETAAMLAGEPCDHYVIKRRGDLACRTCNCRYILTPRGGIWVKPLMPSERGRMGGRPKKEKTS